MKQLLFNLKLFIGKTRLYKPLRRLRSILFSGVVFFSRASIAPTVYILSPYKTGTTYVDSLWSNRISKHEPFDVYSLKYFGKEFETTFIKRSRALNLKLECSGFLSLYINELPKITDANRLRYIYILRPPSEWVKSVISFSHKLWEPEIIWTITTGHIYLDTVCLKCSKAMKPKT